MKSHNEIIASLNLIAVSQAVKSIMPDVPRETFFKITGLENSDLYYGYFWHGNTTRGMAPKPWVSRSKKERKRAIHAAGILRGRYVIKEEPKVVGVVIGQASGPIPVGSVVTVIHGRADTRVGGT